MTVKISSILQRQKIPERIRINLENPNWKQQKTHLSQPETFKKKQKDKEKNFEIFRKIF